MDIEFKLLNKISNKKKKNAISIINQEVANYFYCNPTDKYNYIAERLKSLENAFLEMLNQEKFSPIDFQSETSFFTYGLISSSNGEKIHDKVYIYNPNDCNNVPMKLDLTQTDGYSIFNGQAVALKGRNPTGKQIIIERIFCLPVLNYKKNSNDNCDLTVMKGPFLQSTIENLAVDEYTTHIFLGPFCNFNSGGFDSINQFISYLENKLIKFPHAKFIIVPSAEDYGSFNVFPQPPIQIKSTKIISLPNPSIFTLNSHLIFISNFDSFTDIFNDEIYKPFNLTKDPLATSDKILRIAYHMVFQKSFVPILSSKYPVAYGDWLNMKITPHLYIMSSMIKHNVMDVGCTSLINVEHGDKCEIEYDIELSKFKFQFNSNK